MLEKLLEVFQSEKDAYHALSALLDLIETRLGQADDWWDDDYSRILNTLHAFLREEYGRVVEGGDDPPAILDSWPPCDELGVKLDS